MSPRVRRDHDHKESDARSEAEYRFRPRQLRKCIYNALATPLPVEGTNETHTCISEERVRVPVTTRDKLLRRENIFIEMETFNNCLCDIHSPFNYCNFNLLIVQQNKTVLETCLGEREFNVHLHHTSLDANFTCDMKKSGRRIACRPNDVPVPPRETRFQYVLDCLGESLPDFSCPITTAAPPGVTTAAPPESRIALLVMALLISLLLGVLGTWLGIFCWRKRSKRRRINRPLPPLMPRPEHSSLPNLYDEDYTEENIYDVVKAVDESPTTHPVPDLLSRVPSLPPITPRPPLGPQVEVDKDKAAYNRNSSHSEFYEPLLRGHSTSQNSDHTSPKTTLQTEDSYGGDYLPLLPDRDSREIPETEPVKRFHPYDTPDESFMGTEAGDASITTPKIVEGQDDKPSEAKPEYHILEPPGGHTRGASKNQEHTTLDIKEGVTPDTHEETSPQTIEEKGRVETSPNDSGYVKERSNLIEEPTHSSKSPESETDSDGYEIPVSEEAPAFDIASSFIRKGPKSEGVHDKNKDDVVDV
ncbi:uncharacterized protein LOC124118210 [Haliotis rufescens]|uniref:uncharacterized protein LOC124118210 n=1 Tax=Haliotis rufescens TaxID=6454 RepID=UPI001EB080FB|nr:uncharacterized protein LOC124118210 [Haliotis rufescens]XP_046336289.1 uncharacterized protein LOC124118210 [Haliotis rufescens]